MSGALAFGYVIAALFFLRFWRQSHDRLFGLFSAAFFLLGFQRLALTITSSISGPESVTLWPYLVRLAAFVLILWGIIDKNRGQ